MMPTGFSIATRWRLHTKYPHAGIVIDGNLYDATLDHGLAESLLDDAPNWDLFKLPSDPEIIERFYAREGAQYDVVSLFAFVFPCRVRDSRRVYCYEWCWYAMTGENPYFRVTPEMLLAQLQKMKGAEP